MAINIKSIMQPIRQIRQAHCRQAQGRRVKSNKVLVVIILVVAVVGGFVAYQQYSIWADKRKFEQARASIDALYADIVAQAGQPDRVEKSQTCGYANRKYEQGPLSCSVKAHFAFSADNNTQATEIAEKVHQTISVKTDIAKVTYSNQATALPF